MIIKQAEEVLRIEADSILGLINKIDENFTRMVELIVNARGRVIISGIGKSGLIGKKIVATMNSTGTRSIFLHPVEAVHGDLGIVTAEDVFIGLSNSGETVELNALIPSIHKIGCPVIAFTGNTASTLASLSDITIDVGVEKEACPMGLAPTSSTTALLAMGDALSVVLINRKNFKSSDFSKFHPGGSLGQRLSGHVSDIMLPEDSVPCVDEEVTLMEGIQEIDRGRLGVVIIKDATGTLAGILTDGDVRHLVASIAFDSKDPIKNFMIRTPAATKTDTPVYDALNIMESRQITVLPVTDTDGRVAGILHLHDILGKGAFKFNGK